jgi:hypothetical protein
MKKIVDIEKWNEFTSRLLDDLNMGAYSTGAKHMAYDATKWLEAQPDAEEKHGKWVRKDDIISTYAKCTNCNNGFVCEGEWGFVFWSEYMHYCPNCGAKMDLGEE